MATHQRVFVYDPATDALHITPVTNIGMAGVQGLSVAFGLSLVIVFAAIGAVAQSLAYSITMIGAGALIVLLTIIVRRHEAVNDSEESGSLPARVGNALRSLRRRRTIPDAMLRRALDVVVPISVVGLIYSGLQMWVDSRIAAPEATRTLRWLEQTSIWLRSVNPLTRFVLKTPKWVEAGSIAALAAASILVPLFGRIMLWWTPTSRWIGRVYVALTLIAAMTFFGQEQGRQFDAAAARLNQQSDRIRADYAALRHEVESRLAHVVAQEAVRMSPSARVWAHAQTELSTARAEADHARSVHAEQDPRFAKWAARFEDARRGEQTARGVPIGLEHTPAVSTSGQKETAPDSDHWSPVTARDLERDVTHYADAINKRAPNDPLEQVAAKAAEVIHAEWKTRIVKPALAAVGLEGDLIDLVLDPLMHTPVKEWLKGRVAEGVDDVLAHRDVLQHVSDRFRTDVRERLARLRDVPSNQSRHVVDTLAQYDARAVDLVSDIREIARDQNAKLDARADRLLESESDGTWGSLRRRAIGIFRASRYDADQKAMAIAALRRWDERKREIARQAALTSKQESGRQNWEPDFYKYLQSDADLAGVWGYLVIATQDVNPRVRTDSVIPEDGMIHYVESTRVATQSDVRALYGRRAVELAVDALCPKTHPSQPKSFTDRTIDGFTTPRAPSDFDWLQARPFEVAKPRRMPTWR